MKIPFVSVNKPLIKKVAVLSAFVLIGYLPFVSVIPAAGFLKELLCVLICACAIANREFRPNWGTFCVFAYTFSVVISAVSNSALGFFEKMDVIRYRCTYAVAFCMLFSGFRFTKKELRRFGEDVLQTIFLTSLAVALVGAVEFLVPEVVYALYGEKLTPHLTFVFDGGTAKRLVSTMGNPINLGLQMSLPIIAGLYFLNKKVTGMSVTWKIIYGLSIVLFAVVAIYTYSRTAYVVIAGAVLTFFLVRVLFDRRSRIDKKLLLKAMGAAAIVVVAFLALNKDIASRLGNISIKAFLNNARFSRAYSAFQAADSGFWQILFGHGAGSLMGETKQYVFELGYASLLYEAGVVGIFLFGFAVVQNLRATIKAMNKGKRMAPLMLVYLCNVVGFCVAMIAEDVYFQLPLNLHFWFSIFMTIALGECSPKRTGGGTLQDDATM